MHTRLEPKIFAIFREGYSRKQFYSDLAAGTTVGIVALPLAIAFAGGHNRQPVRQCTQSSATAAHPRNVAVIGEADVLAGGNDCVPGGTRIAAGGGCG